MARILVGLDRDGTLFKDTGYFGRDDNWKERLEFFDGVIEGLKRLDDKFTLILATNQAGLARGFYGVERVKEIHDVIQKKFSENGIKIHSWQYAGYVGQEYAKRRNLEKDNPWVVDDNDPRLWLRKPGCGMLEKGAEEMDMSLSDFNKIYFIGDKMLDVETGINARGTGILLFHGSDEKREHYEREAKNRKGMVVVKTFMEAIEFIISDST